MKIRFLGAAGTVTGSKFLLESGKTRLLIDCGLFQGVKALRLRNRKPLPFAVTDLTGVVLTHAHIDHTGYLPVLVRDGYSGPIYCTPPTQDLCQILLADSAKLQEEEAWYANKKGYSRHRPAAPLYTSEDAQRVFGHLKSVPMDQEWTLGELRLRYQTAGHILGAASVQVTSDHGSVLFSGDLGRLQDALMPAPAPPPASQWIVMESTYGNREHSDADPIDVLADVVTRTTARDGKILIASFAVGRAQILLYHLDRMFRERRMARVPIFIDSPMATDVTELYVRHHQYHRLSQEQCAHMCKAASFLRSRDESMTLNHLAGPAIIISASGMLTGGRILHHLKRLASNPANTILLPGFQAPGTRGADLVHGVRAVKVHGRYCPVNAEVVPVDLFSAHADRSELTSWLGSGEAAPREVFLVHGEPVAADRLRLAIGERLGLEARAAEDGETVTLA